MHVYKYCAWYWIDTKLQYVSVCNIFEAGNYPSVSFLTRKTNPSSQLFQDRPELETSGETPWNIWHKLGQNNLRPRFNQVLQWMAMYCYTIWFCLDDWPPHDSRTIWGNETNLGSSWFSIKTYKTKHIILINIILAKMKVSIWPAWPDLACRPGVTKTGFPIISISIGHRFWTKSPVRFHPWPLRPCLNFSSVSWHQLTSVDSIVRI